MAKSWIYAQVPGVRVGLMVCTACQKKITEGQFRYHTTEDAHLPQHRACSESDPNWAMLDKKAADEAAFEKRRLAAYADFVKEFGEPTDLVAHDDHR